MDAKSYKLEAAMLMIKNHPLTTIPSEHDKHPLATFLKLGPSVNQLKCWCDVYCDTYIAVQRDEKNRRLPKSSFYRIGVNPGNRVSDHFAHISREEAVRQLYRHDYALHVAAAHCDVGLIRFMFEFYPSGINARSKFLEAAIAGGQSDASIYSMIVSKRPSELIASTRPSQLATKKRAPRQNNPTPRTK